MLPKNWRELIPFTVGGILIVTVSSMVLSLLLGTYIVLSPSRQGQAATSFGYLGPIGIVMLPLLDYFQGLVAIGIVNLVYAAFLFSLILKPNSLVQSATQLATGNHRAWRENGATAVTTTFGFLIFLSYIVQNLLEQAGLRTGSLPPSEPLSQFISIALAPLNEELTFRLLTIGTVAGIISIGPETNLRSFMTAIWRPKLVSGRPASLAIWIAWVVSGLYFGAAHFLYSGGTWGPGKAITASIQGLAIGLLHIQYGFHAAVLLHWAFNYHSTVAYFVDQIYSSAFTSALVDVSGIIEVLTVASGTLLVAYALLNWAGRQIYRAA